MPAYALIGGQWGDEGKGKVIDSLLHNGEIDGFIRDVGGANAGHMVCTPWGPFAFHTLPEGLAVPEMTCSLGANVNVNFSRVYNEDAVNPGEFQRFRDLTGIGMEELHRRLRISKNARLVLPQHLLEDELQERKRGAAIGTTLTGNGPVTADAYARVGLRVGDLLRPRREFRRIFERFWDWKMDLLRSDFYQVTDEDFARHGLDDKDASFQKHLEFRDIFGPCLVDLEPLLIEEYRKGARLLFGVAHGFLLDITHGTYPWVTSSSVSVGALLHNAPFRFDRVIGVFKAYSTRVGGGPLPTEMPEGPARRLRELAGEYGTTTGRARRMGWFDGVAARYTKELLGLTDFVLTRLDTLDDFCELKVATRYRIGSERGDADAPQSQEWKKFFHVANGGIARPVYKTMEAWGPWQQTGKRAAGARTLEELPEEARQYATFIKYLVGCPMFAISTGPSRDDMIFVGSEKGRL